MASSTLALLLCSTLFSQALGSEAEAQALVLEEAKVVELQEEMTTAEATMGVIQNATKIAAEAATQIATLEAPKDSTAWMLEGLVPSFLLMAGPYLKYICMLAYTYYHGCKLFKTLEKDSSFPYKFVRMIFQCTGGGLLVPIFINAIPVSLGNDAYPICILISTILHTYSPGLRDLVNYIPFVKVAMIVMYETQRASVVVKLTKAAAAAIPASDFSFALFGPIFCGAIAGCGGAFLPLTKGLKPIEKGLADNMFSAFLAAAAFHLFYHTPLSDGIPEAAKKGQVMVAYFFIAYSLKEVKEIATMFENKQESKIKEVVEAVAVTDEKAKKQ